MRRTAVILVLVVCLLGVLYLVMGPDEDFGPGTRGDTASRATLGSDGPEDVADIAASAVAGGAIQVTGDNDPNRIEGAPLTLRGIVLRDGRPVADAQVSAQRAYPAYINNYWNNWHLDRYNNAPMAALDTKKTGADGRFELQVARRSRLVIQARAEGSAVLRRLIYAPAEGDPGEITLKLSEGFRVVGRVLDPDGEGIDGVTVTASLRGNYRMPPIFLSTTTNKQGEFRIDSLTAGWTGFIAEAQGYATMTQSLSLPANHDVVFTLDRGGAVKGRVLDNKGAALGGATVTVKTGSSGRADTQTDGDGQYIIEHILPGDISNVQVTHPEYGTRSSQNGQVSLPTDVVRLGETLLYDIVVARGITVKGVAVRAADDKPVANAMLKLAKVSDQFRNHQDVGYAVSRADGRFEFRNVLPGNYAIEATAGNYARMIQRNHSAQTPLTLDFFVEEGESVGTQRVLLEPAGSIYARITGVPPEELDLDQMTVNLNLAGNYSRWGAVDALGTVAFEHIAAGESAQLQSWNPQAKSDAITVEAGTRHELELKVEDSGGFAGVVEDQDGNPIQGALVRALAANQLQQARNLAQNSWGAGTTDRNGRYHVKVQDWMRNQAQGQSYVLVAAHRDYLAASVPDLKLPPKGETREVSLQLETGGEISGQVVFPDGKPVTLAWVWLNPSRDVKDKSDFRQSRGMRTDFEGRFRIQGVGPGNYGLSASTTDGSASLPNVQAGAQGLRIEIVVKAFIAGFVIDEEGQPVAGAQVRAFVWEGDKKKTKMSSQTAANGHFRIGYLDQGQFALEVTPKKSQRRYYGQANNAPGFEPKEIDPVPTGTDNVVIEVSTGVTVRGRVTSNGRGVGAAMVIAMQRPSPKAKGGGRKQPYAPTALSNTRGEFKIKGVGSNPLELLVAAPGYLPATALVEPGDENVEIRIEEGREIAGVVHQTDGTPLRNTWMQVQPADGEINRNFSSWDQRAGNSWRSIAGTWGGRTDAKGKFKFTGLYPGEYNLRVWGQEEIMGPLKVQSGDTQLSLRTEKAMTIQGRVVDKAGNAVVGPKNQRPNVMAMRSGQWGSGSAVDADGHFELKGLTAGTWTLQTNMSGYQQTKLEVQAGDSNVQLVIRAAPPPKKKKGS